MAATTYLFLDDWALDGWTDMRRCFAMPERVEIDPETNGVQAFGIVKDDAVGCYRGWSDVPYRHADGSDEPTSILSYFTSEDGLRWKETDHTGPVDLRFPERGNSIALERKLGHSIMLDECDPDPCRRHKCIGHAGHIFTSPDGFQWTYDPNRSCFPGMTDSYSDCINQLLWNPVTGNYQVSCRPTMADRRIALVQSSDLKEWTEPQIILHPDMLDAPLTQYYSLYQYWTGSLFVGFLHKYHVPHHERRWEHKMWGYTESELVYSYNGVNWIQPMRRSFFEHPEPPVLGSNSIYAGTIIDLGNTYRMYANGSVMHGSAETLPDDAPRRALLIYSLRKDGFCYFDTIGGWGTLWTRSVRPAAADLTLNIKAVDPNSHIEVQVLDNRWNVIPGFSFNDCVPLVGDHVAAAPQWKEKSLAELNGAVCKLEFRLFNARIYAFSWSADIVYGPSFSREQIDSMTTRKGNIRMR